VVQEGGKKTVKAEFIVIGVDQKGEKVVGSEKTRQQIERVKKLECALQHKGKPFDWSAFDNPDEPRTLFQAILKDREMRVDNKTLMADRPPVAVITVIGDRAVRLEYYAGHDALELVYDVRAKELERQSLPRWMERDPHAYDPSEFLEKTFGISQEVSKPLLDCVHRRENVPNDEFNEAMRKAVASAGIPEDYAAANPTDAFMRAALGKPLPTRNDCGYQGRFEFEDNSRMGGWATEGEGMCDYPDSCPWFKQGKCPIGKEG
jgi:transcriptional regulator of met regulon